MGNVSNVSDLDLRANYLKELENMSNRYHQEQEPNKTTRKGRKVKTNEPLRLVDERIRYQQEQEDLYCRYLEEQEAKSKPTKKKPVKKQKIKSNSSTKKTENNYGGKHPNNTRVGEGKLTPEQCETKKTEIKIKRAQRNASRAEAQVAYSKPNVVGPKPTKAFTRKKWMKFSLKTALVVGVVTGLFYGIKALLKNKNDAAINLSASINTKNNKNKISTTANNKQGKTDTAACSQSGTPLNTTTQTQNIAEVSCTNTTNNQPESTNNPVNNTKNIFDNEIEEITKTSTIVNKGDCLWNIAKRELEAANPDKIITDAQILKQIREFGRLNPDIKNLNLIFPNQNIKLCA